MRVALLRGSEIATRTLGCQRSIITPENQDPVQILIWYLVQETDDHGHVHVYDPIRKHLTDLLVDLNVIPVRKKS